MIRLLLCKIWKTTSIALVLLFALSQTGAYAVGAGSVFFSFPEKWREVKEEELEKKREQVPFSSKKAPVPFSVDWRLSGNMVNRTSVDTIFNDNMEDRYEIHSRSIIENKIKVPKYNLSGVVSVDLKYDLRGNGEAHSKFAPLLHEAYAELKESNLRLRAGLQNVTWGKLDDFTLIDIVNPQDYTESILVDKQMRKIPVLMAKIDYFAPDGKFIETFFTPRFRPNKIDYFGSDWAVFRYLKEDVEDGNSTQAVKDMVDNIRIEDGDEVDNSLENFEMGLRVGGRSEVYDYSFYYMYIHERNPSLASNTGIGRNVRELLYNPNTDNLAALAALGPTAEDLKLLTDYNRMHVFGGDFETTIESLGVRGEIGLFLNPHYVTNDFSIAEKSTLSAGIGVDHTTADDLYLNFQFIEDIILSYEELYDAEKFSHQLVGTISKDFLRGKLVPAFYFGYNFSYKDYFLNPKISYTWNEDYGTFIITAGAFFFEGKPAMLLGRYDKNDLYYMEAEYKF